jgi:hypothetical protein
VADWQTNQPRYDFESSGALEFERPYMGAISDLLEGKLKERSTASLAT